LAQLLAGADQRSGCRVALGGGLSGRESVPGLQQLRQRGRGAQRRVEQHVALACARIGLDCRRPLTIRLPARRDET
jgi:hypothetical protein